MGGASTDSSVDRELGKGVAGYRQRSSVDQRRKARMENGRLTPFAGQHLNKVFCLSQTEWRCAIQQLILMRSTDDGGLSESRKVVGGNGRQL
jgi:hypothetical protein